MTTNNQERTWTNESGETIRVVREGKQIVVYHSDIPGERMIWVSAPVPMAVFTSKRDAAVLSASEIAFISQAAQELNA